MDSETLTAILFIAVVLITVAITFWASRQTKGAADFYAGGRSFSGFQNGMAISGDYRSAASFLGISGAIALTGYDGFLYSIGFLVAWLIALLLVFGLSGAASLVAAEPCTSAESSAADDDCSPTCVTCGCCHQAHEVTALVVTLAPVEAVRERTSPSPRLGARNPRDILHVPRLGA